MTKTIGETNGVWGYLFKFTLVMVPPSLVWMAWITQNQILDNERRSEGPRFTEKDFDNKSEVIISRLEPRLARIETQLEVQSQIRPDDFRSSVRLLDQSMDLRFENLMKYLKEEKQ